MKTNFRKQEHRLTKTLVENRKTETMKTKISQVAAAFIFILILLAGNVNAKGTELIASSLEKIEEPAMEVENWMVNDNYWNTSDVVFYIDEILEENLQLESWMIDENSWGKQNVLIVVKDSDNNLSIESWMINNNFWN